jgi:hypothetical protein
MEKLHYETDTVVHNNVAIFARGLRRGPNSRHATAEPGMPLREERVR